MYAWLGLLALLIVGLLVRTQDAHFIPLWITEGGAVFLLGFFLYRANNWTALGALGGSATWLINQLLNWYGEALGVGGWMQGSVAGYTTVYVVTAGVVCLLGYLAFTKKGGSAPLVSSLGGLQKAGLLAFGVMGLFGFWKIYITYSLPWSVSVDIYSRVFWGLGIGLMGFATAWSLKKNKKEAIYIVLIGLAIAAISAIGYGRGLSLIT